MSVSAENSIRSLNDSERNYMRPDEGDNYSIITDTTVDDSIQHQVTRKGRNGRMYENLKLSDSDYHKITRREGGVKIKTEVYSTCITPGTLIRDAITGHKQANYHVGTWKEDLFFKVHEASGHIGCNSYVLFYDSPEQFERHMKINISNSVKRKWTDKFARARDMLEQ
jgi:hypothetical protein